VDPRAGLDNVEKRKFLTLQGLELRPLGRPARRQSLYGLRYPGSFPSLCFAVKQPPTTETARKTSMKDKFDEKEEGKMTKHWPW
jgi:hypothetical protein